MGPTKSPGPDGIPGMFYQRCWHFIKDDVTQAVKAVLNSGFVLREMNRTFITLIPKKEGPEMLADYRPISLCNVFMRIVTKCLTNRLKKIIDKLIGSSQNAFIPGRNISDSILISHEILHNIKSTCQCKIGKMAIKVDMTQPYARINWNFLRGGLITTGFPTQLLTFIRNWFISVSYEVLLNGVPQSQFKPQGELRQGDPLSPYLYVLCMNVLSNMLDKEAVQHRYLGIQIARAAPRVNHLFFADDALFFTSTIDGCVTSLLSVINRYCEASGQGINKRKSSLIFSPNTGMMTRHKVTAFLGIQESQSLGTYLGTPTDFSRPKKVIFQELIELVQRRLSSWTSILLSPAGRLTLISFVVTNLSIYFISVFKIPISV